jgi:hypothetical protein
MFIQRSHHLEVVEYLEEFPIVGLLGPRQCGKSTLAKEILKTVPKETIYIDLERDSDINKLNQPELFFESNKDKLICLDEIQRKPDLFPLLRSLVDSGGINGRFLILGSASPDLIRQSSESLAGRIAYIELTPFSLKEVYNGHFDLMEYWNRGGFPKSYLAKSDRISVIWRENYIRNFLERDISQFGFNISVGNMRRLWTMLAHVHGQEINYSKLSNSLQVSHTTIRNYIDILVETFMVRLIKPYHSNFGKRIVKAPRIYLRDTGILNTLLGIDTAQDLFGHPVFGASWEGLVTENLLAVLQSFEAYYFRTTAGAEVDLILERGSKKIMIECKASKSPSLSKGFYNIKKDLKPYASWIIAPVEESYQIEKDVIVGNIKHFIDSMR